MIRQFKSEVQQVLMAEDKAALSAYLESRHKQNSPTIATVKDVDFNQKLQAAIAQKLRNSTAT